MGQIVKLLVAAILLTALPVADAQAQSRRSPSRQVHRGAKASSSASGGTSARADDLPPGFGFGTHPGFSGRPGDFIPDKTVGDRVANTPPAIVEESKALPRKPPRQVYGKKPNAKMGTKPGSRSGYKPGYEMYDPYAGYDNSDAGYWSMWWYSWSSSGPAFPTDQQAGRAPVPGIGITGPVVPGSAPVGPSVHGGTLIPGFGVVSGIR